MVQEANSEAEKSASVIRPFNEQDLVLLAKLTRSEPKYILIVRQVVSRATCDALALVSPEAQGIIGVDPHEDVEEIRRA